MPRIPKPWFRKDRNAWFVTIDGRRHNLGPKKKEAMEAFYNLMNAPKEASVSPSSFAATADLFLEWLSKNRSVHTYEWYRYRIERFCQRYPDLLNDNIRPYHIQQWVDSYELSQTSKRNYIRSIKGCMAWAVKQGHIATNPVAFTPVPTAQSREIMLTPEEFEAMMSRIPDPSLKMLCTVTYQTGCRPQELLRVEARHVDFTHERWVFPIDESKGRRAPRVVYLTTDALDLTRKLVERFPTGRLFRNAGGDPWTVSAVNCAFKRLQYRMGKAAFLAKGLEVNEFLTTEMKADPQLQHLTPGKLSAGQRRKLVTRIYNRYAPKYCLYALRHAWATCALQTGTDALTVAILMGHKDPSTLSRVYQHLSHNPTHLLQQARKATARS